MFCQACGIAIPPSGQFCPACGTAVISQEEAIADDIHRAVGLSGQVGLGPKAGPRNRRVILLVLGTAFILAAGAVAALFYGIRYFYRSSGAGKAAVLAARQSSAVHEALGEITDVGTPFGHIHVESGGSGNASLSMTVEGTKGRGEYYATLQRHDGVWAVVSSRLELNHGRSIDIEEQEFREKADVPLSAGRQLRSDPFDVDEWSEIEWPRWHLRLLCPPGWVESERSDSSLSIKMDKVDSFIHFNGAQILNGPEATYQEPGFALLALDLRRAAEFLRDGEIAGYALREVGGVPGILTIFNNEDGRRQATWNGSPAPGAKREWTNIYLETRESDFERFGSTFNAVLDSVRFD